MALDLRKNFARGILSANISAVAAQIVMNPGNSLPTVVGNFPLVIWDHSTYPDPADDINLEIVTASYAGIVNTYDIVRAKEDTSASAHSSGDRAALHFTAQMSLDDLANHVHATSAITSGVFVDDRISESSITQHVGAIDPGSILGLGDDDHSLYHTDSRAASWLAANHETTCAHSDIALNATHRSSDGSDHTYIDQDLRISTSPTFAGLHINSAEVVSTTLLTLESDIDNDTEYNEILFKVIGGVNYGAIRSYVGQYTGNSYMSLLTTTDGGTLVEQVTIQHDGKVGFGKPLPSQKLDIVAGNSGVLISDTGENRGVAKSLFFGDGGGTWTPIMWGVAGASSDAGLHLLAETEVADDSGTEPLIRLNARQRDSTPITTRPLLSIENDGSQLVTVDKDGDVGITGAVSAGSFTGLVIGTDIQAHDAVLDDISALAVVADNEFIVGTGAGTYAHESGATARTSIGLGNVENTQLSTWAGSSNITTLGTIATGVWEGTSIAVGYTDAKCVAVWPDTYTADQNLLITSTPRFARIGINTAASVNVKLKILDVTINTTSSLYGIFNWITKIAGITNVADNFFGIYNRNEYNQSGGVIGTSTAFYNQFSLIDGDIGDVSNSRNLSGVYSFIDLDAGKIYGDAFGFRTVIDQEATNEVTGNIYGNYIDIDADGTVGGSVYGLYLNEGSNVDYGIYQNGTAPNVFGGTVSIGAASGSGILSVEGADANQKIATFKGDDASHNRICVCGPIDADSQLSFMHGGSPVWSIGNNADNDAFTIRTGVGAFGTNDKFAILSNGNVGIGEPAPETLTEWTGATPYLTLHNSTQEDSDGGRESRIIFKGEQSGGEETELAVLEVSHDGASDDQLGKVAIGVNTGSGVVAALEIGSDLLATFAGAIASNTLTFSTVGPTDNVGVTGINTLFIDNSGNAVTIGGFAGGVDGQVLHVVLINAGANNVTLEHNEAEATQKIYLHRGADETLNTEYGGWVFVCHGGVDWHDCSHAKHV